MAAPRKAKVRFKERSDLLDFLLEVSAATSETLDLDRLLANVAEIVKRVIDCELLAILLYTDRYKEMRIRYSHGHRPELVNNLSLKLDEGLTGAAASSREPVLVGDVRNDPRYIRAVDAVRSELAVPMVARGTLVGVLDVQSTRLNAYTEYDRALLRLIGSRVAVAIDNARLYRRVQRDNLTLRTMAEISGRISSILDLDVLLERISKLIRGVIYYDAFAILLLNEQSQNLRHRFSIRYDQRVDADHIPLDRGITGAAALSKEPVRVADTTADPRYIATHPGVRSEIAVPLIVRDKVIGVMDLECDKVGFFTEDHQRTLVTLAPQIASAVENARLYEEVADRERRMDQDLKAASELQRLILPAKAPDITGLEIGIGLRPAREISGDIYDFFEHTEDHSVIAFGDVSGKGVAAALFGAMLSGLLRTLAPRRRSPAVLLKALNDALSERKVEGRYATLLVMLWHPHSMHLSMASAGALPPMVIRNGEAVKLRVEGVPIGLLEDREYEDTTFQVRPGDCLVLFSDGIEDQANEKGEEYGRHRLAKIVKASCISSADEIVAKIYADVDKHARGRARFDDQTLMVLKVKEQV
jgi:phosphoserine phosphatase RsbU/P